jgi:glycosyltransferase involved in cell wall biosynthesis
MKPRRVLHISRESDGGLAVVLDQVVRGLNRRLYEPIVAFDTSWPSDIRSKLYDSNIRVIDLKNDKNDQGIVSIKRRREKRDLGGWIQSKFGKKYCDVYLSIKYFIEFVFQDIPKIKVFLRIIRENKIDVIHSHRDLHSAKPEIIASQICGIPCVTHNHGYPRYTYFDRLFTRFVTSSIYISKDIAEKYIAQGESREKGIVINNGVDANRFMQTNTVSSVREEFNINSKEVLIGIIGRIDWWKGQDYFIEAIGKVTKTIPNIKAMIIGGLYNDARGRNRHYIKRLKSLVSTQKLDDKIIFTGFRHDIPRFIASLDLVIHASSEPEPFGLVIIEAMAAGKALIGTAAGGVLDIIEDGVNGVLVPCKDSASMAKAILKIIAEPQWARRMGGAARQCVKERFTVQRQVLAVQKLYDSILKQRHVRI